MSKKDKKKKAEGDTSEEGGFFVVPKKAANQSLTLMVSAFGLVSALAWNEAIKALLNKLFKTDGTIISLFIYAILVTVMAVVITNRLSKYLDQKAN